MSSRNNTPIIPSYRASSARYGQTLPLDLSKPQMSSPNTPAIPSYRASLARYGQALPLDLSKPHMSSPNTPIIPSYRASLSRYGQTLPLDLPKPHMSSSNTPIIPSYRANLAQNTSSSCLGSQDFADGFRNHSKPNLHNQKNFRYHSGEEGSNDFDPLSMVDINSFRNLHNYVAPIATPPIRPSGNANLGSTRESIIPSYRANLARNSSSSCLGSQGLASSFRKPSKPNLHNQKKFRYHPYREGSDQKNNSLVFNDFDPLSRVDMNSFRNLKNYVPPIATTRPICPSVGANLELTRERTTEHHNLNNIVAPIATPPPPPVHPSGNANLDLTRETTTEHCMLDIQNTIAWKRLTASPDGCHEEIQTPKEELLLFKDDKNTFATSSVIESGPADANDDKGLDLTLSLSL
ncbi:unnamed protein product [Trifolium pratense]|uniref:Uncharacterized protein n=1 Tax=Trifolium pratense TaxID=57577 RepID=A0ACB0IQ61_TRIPR|nr:unnamed protein product [Trifolium pratense]